MPAEKSIVMGMRLPPSLLETLRALALTNRRPIGMQTLIVLEEGFKAMGVPYGQEPAAKSRRGEAPRRPKA